MAKEAAYLECIKVAQPFVYRQSEAENRIRRVRNADYAASDDNSDEFEDSGVPQYVPKRPLRQKSHRCLGTVEKRNARERSRVYIVNQAFSTLRNRVPTLKDSTKRVSKLRILKSAINYIYALKDQLADSGAHVGYFGTNEGNDGTVSTIGTVDTILELHCTELDGSAVHTIGTGDTISTSGIIGTDNLMGANGTVDPSGTIAQPETFIQLQCYPNITTYVSYPQINKVFNEL
ncbi:unnamed protein product [Bursaphelenchus okinawaensis]|uniref:BHLH domain-containing protein n=1 Tax=Bursaphelenchus okinawaensis TaxID=465554 RepID=A0A811KQA5_9BILA|nr:unnamed protein product [Bursaphelenchus okinawaensis]CAG9107380.1 unnamed protein product [Bursaphelenchus okinawaensis]